MLSPGNNHSGRLSILKDTNISGQTKEILNQLIEDYGDIMLHSDSMGKLLIVGIHL